MLPPNGFLFTENTSIDVRFPKKGGIPSKPVGPSSVNLVEEGGSSKNNQKLKGKRKFQGKDNKGSNKKQIITCWKCGKVGHFKKDCRVGKHNKEAGPSGSKDPNKQQGQNLVQSYNSVLNYVSLISEACYVQDDDIAWWVDSVATSHVCKDLRWFKDFQPIEDGFVIKMGNVATEPIKGLGKVKLVFTSGKCLCLDNVLYVPWIRKNLLSGIMLNNCGYKQVLESDKFILSRHGTFVGFGYLCNVGIIHQTTAPYTPQQNGVSERKNRVLKEMVNSMLSYSGLSEEHSKAYRFYVIEPNDYISVNTVVESRDAIFDEERFSSISRPKDMIVSSSNSEEINHKEIPSTSTEPRRSKRARIAKDFGFDFQLYLVEGSRDEIQAKYEYCFNIEEDPKTYNEAMASRDVAFWKEAINDEMDSIMQNNTWRLTDLPPGCKPLGCKWIFKKKMKVDGSIDKFKARLVIQGFRQKEGIDYFDTYAPVARISTIRFLIALGAIHNLVIHQMDVKTAFLNGDLDEEIYMKQPEGFVLPGNEHKVCKLVKSLYGLKQAPKQWHQKFDDVVLSSGYVLNQSDKCVYSKFDNSDMGEAEVILGIRIKHENNGICITQSHYIEKISKKFNFQDCFSSSTPMDPNIKLLPNKGVAVSQLEYSRVIGSLMYAMISTRPDIAFAVGKLSRYTSNPSSNYWQALNRVLRYLKGTMNYGLNYTRFPSILEGYSDASWITNMEDHSSTSGWVFLLGGGAISWASKKQTCITHSTMESEFVALAATGKEAEWLKNLIYEIPLWPKPISPISIRCDSVATLAKAYNQVYNGKSRHLGVRHNMIRDLITNGVISLEFVKTQQNLADHLTKGFCRDLVHKSAKGMGLKCEIKRTTYMNMKFNCFKKLRLGFDMFMKDMDIS
ncbi:hypothetical protein E3N88_13182 [Mikania micrantha]|uniref:CCHC-type domain-containing protein n=1 Tax=Mikania micrantha TaxID=192012 RepID=A0A5N6P814_9ASTR|nr:hypothetical protein E3N88_13182 [Mikania micrantha]